MKERPDNGASKELSGDDNPRESSSGSSKGSKNSNMSDEYWEEMDLRATSVIRLNLTKNILANVHGISLAKEFWEKLEAMYQAKSISNQLYLKEWFHTLRMAKGTKISDHLGILKGIISELKVIRVEIGDEDEALKLILSLPPSYEHMKPILMYEKEALDFVEATSKVLLEERRLNSEGHTSQEDSVMLASNWKKKKEFVRKKVYWECGQSGHMKRNCPNSVCSSKSSDLDANIVSVVTENDNLFHSSKAIIILWYVRFTMIEDVMLAVPQVFTRALTWWCVVEVMLMVKGFPGEPSK